MPPFPLLASAHGDQERLPKASGRLSDRAAMPGVAVAGHDRLERGIQMLADALLNELPPQGCHLRLAVQDDIRASASGQLPRPATRGGLRGTRREPGPGR